MQRKRLIINYSLLYCSVLLQLDYFVSHTPSHVNTHKLNKRYNVDVYSAVCELDHVMVSLRLSKLLTVISSIFIVI